MNSGTATLSKSFLQLIERKQWRIAEKGENIQIEVYVIDLVLLYAYLHPNQCN